jgi:hypothetical protein
MDPNHSIGHYTCISTRYRIGLFSKCGSKMLTTDPCNACAGPASHYQRVLIQGERETIKWRTGTLEYTYCDILDIGFLKESGLVGHAKF